MIFQQLLNEESGCLSYLIGCAQAGRAVIVDPGRDRVHEYLRLARKKGLTITDVVETHTHADHISGNRDLAAATKATIRVHRAAGTAACGPLWNEIPRRPCSSPERSSGPTGLGISQKVVIALGRASAGRRSGPFAGAPTEFVRRLCGSSR